MELFSNIFIIQEGYELFYFDLADVRLCMMHVLVIIPFYISIGRDTGVYFNVVITALDTIGELSRTKSVEKFYIFFFGMNIDIATK